MPPKRAASPIPDDWENDDSDEDVDEEHNRRIWEEANAKTPAPMPTIVSTSSAGQALPPPAAFQPALRILKRPSPSSPEPSSNSSTSDSSTLKERETRYQAARERIFGDSEDSTPSATPLASPAVGTNTPPPVVRIVREPRGPGESKDSESGKGFARRGGGKAGGPSKPGKQ